MAVKNIRQRIIAFVAGVLLGPAIVWAGLETGTYISDLVATNPLSSDLASTADDHIRLLKSTIKTTFPNINGAMTATDEQLNAVGASGVTGSANPSASIGLSAVNGSATTFMRSDGAPALDQAIAPTMTGLWKFTRASGGGTGVAFGMEGNIAGLYFKDTGAAADNKIWSDFVFSGVRGFQIYNDAENSNNAWLTVSRSGSSVGAVTFPADGAGGVGGKFQVGTTTTGAGLANVLVQVRTTSSQVALSARTTTSASFAMAAHNEATSGDNSFIVFGTEAGFTTRGSVTYNRAGGLTAYNTTSADNLKKNIRPAKSARKVIDCVKIVSHDWRNNPGHLDYWVTAGTLEPCAPWAVTYQKSPEQDGQVDVALLVPAMIKYIQEQDARIGRLERDAARRH